MECETICYTKGHYFPLHLHPDLYTFSYILGGTAKLIFKDFSVSLQENDLAIIPPNLAHETRIWNSFYYKVIRVPSLYSFSTKDQTSGLNILNGALNYKDSFTKWFQTIRLYQGSAERFTEQMPDNFALFMGPHFTPLEGVQRSLKPSLDFLTQNYNQTINLMELSEVACLSPSHFQRLFKSHLGISPMRYLINLRVEKAKEFIKERASLTAVAYETGFYDQSHFTRCFKTYVGMNPKHYSAIVQK